MQTIYQASVAFGTGALLDLFGQSVSDTLLVDWTPAHELAVTNTGSTDLYLGSADSGGGLGSSTGFPLAPGESARFELPARTRLAGTFGSSLGGSARVLIIFK